MLGNAQLEHEIRGEPVEVAAHGAFQDARCHSVEASQVAVQHDPLSA
jgi:hypothetical protein